MTQSIRVGNITFPFKIGFRDYHDAPAYEDFLNHILPPGTEIAAKEVDYDPEWQDSWSVCWGGPYVFEFNVNNA